MSLWIDWSWLNQTLGMQQTIFISTFIISNVISLFLTYNSITQKFKKKVKNNISWRKKRMKNFKLSQLSSLFCKMNILYYPVYKNTIENSKSDKRYTNCERTLSITDRENCSFAEQWQSFSRSLSRWNVELDKIVYAKSRCFHNEIIDTLFTRNFLRMSNTKQSKNLSTMTNNYSCGSRHI